MNVQYQYNPERIPRSGALLSPDTLPHDIISTVETEEGFKMFFSFETVQGKIALRLLNVEPPFMYVDPRTTDLFVTEGKIAKYQEFMLASPTSEVPLAPFRAASITAPVIEA